jgi:hypothetical protein
MTILSKSMINTLIVFDEESFMVSRLSRVVLSSCIAVAVALPSVAALAQVAPEENPSAASATKPEKGAKQVKKDKKAKKKADKQAKKKTKKPSQPTTAS